jgi:predicted RNase H-like HicB family nuclease
MTTRMRSKVVVGPGLPNFHYDAELVLDHAGRRRVWVARHPQLPGCMSHGVTTDEALANLAEAAELYLAALDAAGVNRPPAPIHPRVMSMEPLRDRQETPPLTDEMPRTIS